MRFYLATILALTAFCWGTLLNAQDYKSPKEFFERGYVNRPTMDLKEDTSKSTSKNIEGAAESDALIPKILESLQPKGTATTETHNPETEITPAADEAAANVMEKQGLKVSSASVILSPDDLGHFKKHYQEFLKLRDDSGPVLKNVYVVGDAEKLLESEEDSIFSEGVEGGVFRYLSELPPVFANVQTSPAYLIDTAQGSVIVEGYPSILKFFNKRGEFIEPEPAP